MSLAFLVRNKRKLSHLLLSSHLQTCSIKPYIRLYHQLFVWGLMSYLRYLCLFTYIGVFCVVCLRLVYHMLPGSLDCTYVIAPSVFSDVYLIYNTLLQHKLHFASY